MKRCVIENAKFSYILWVDGIYIPFDYMGSAEYFENHYKALGYKIIHLDTYKIRDEEELKKVRADALNGEEV